MMGTPDYMPPEQATDAKNADIRADVYALGCTLFHLLTGKPPFSGRSPFEVMQAHQSQPPPPLATLRPDAPAELAALVARMLAKRPEDRPTVPQEVAKALAPFCKAGEKADLPAEKSGPVPQPKSATAVPPGRSVPPLPVSAPPPPGPRTEPPARRGTEAPRRARTEIADRDDERRAPPGRKTWLLVGGAVALVAVTAGVALWASGLFDRRGTTPDGPAAGASEGGDGRAGEGPAYNVELLVNPGCEDPPHGAGLPGWTAVSGNWGRRDRNPLPKEGNFYFFPGQAPLAVLEQLVDVSRYSATIDAGEQPFTFRGYVRSYPVAGGKKKKPKPKPDACRIVTESLAGDAAQVLARTDTGPIVSVGEWRLIEGTRVVPGGTRFIRVRLISVRHSGNNNDGYFDGLSLKAMPPEKKKG